MVEIHVCEKQVSATKESIWQTNCAIKKNYKYLLCIAQKYGNVTVKDFQKYEKIIKSTKRSN